MRNKKGQSTAEFILAFGFMALFVVIFVQMGLNYTKGFVIQYATFMGARSYSVQDNGSNIPESSDDGALQFAKSNVLSKLIKMNRNIEFKSNLPNQGSSPRNVFSGFVVKFKEAFSPSELVGGRDEVHFFSEAFLGRSPTMSDCRINVCEVLKLNTSVGDCKPPFHVTMYDNGC
ncbi:MAG: hypothetical protein CME61_02285 [Halobacteriovoraceae bacterium]|nr:hypothetical protein [Halobacteriovoraceae bacterium]